MHELEKMSSDTNHNIYNFNDVRCKNEEISVNKSFEDMINETYEVMMKNQHLKNKAPAMNPLSLAGCGDVDPLARSSPKVAKLKLIKPKPIMKSSHCYPRIFVSTQSESEHAATSSLPFLTPLNSFDVQQMPSLQQNPHSFIPRSYTWNGLEGLQPNPTLKQIPSRFNFKGVVGYSSYKVNTHSPLNPAARRRKLLPKPILSINQSSSKGILNRPGIKLSPSLNTLPPPLMSTMGARLFKLEIVDTEEARNKYVSGLKKEMKLEFPPAPSSWRMREDPVKMKKNEQERERRLEMAVYRESIRKMLPRTKYVKKVSSAVILQAAKDYCQSLQSQVRIF